MLAAALMAAFLHAAPPAVELVKGHHQDQQAMGETCTRAAPCVETGGARYYISPRGRKRYIRQY